MCRHDGGGVCWTAPMSMLTRLKRIVDGDDQSRNQSHELHGDVNGVGHVVSQKAINEANLPWRQTQPIVGGGARIVRIDDVRPCHQMARTIEKALSKSRRNGVTVVLKTGIVVIIAARLSYKL